MPLPPLLPRVPEFHPQVPLRRRWRGGSSLYRNGPRMLQYHPTLPCHPSTPTTRPGLRTAPQQQRYTLAPEPYLTRPGPGRTTAGRFRRLPAPRAEIPWNRTSERGMATGTGAAARYQATGCRWWRARPAQVAKATRDQVPAAQPSIQPMQARALRTAWRGGARRLGLRCRRRVLDACLRDRQGRLRQVLLCIGRRILGTRYRLQACRHMARG